MRNKLEAGVKAAALKAYDAVRYGSRQLRTLPDAELTDLRDTLEQIAAVLSDKPKESV